MKKKTAYIISFILVLVIFTCAICVSAATGTYTWHRCTNGFVPMVMVNSDGVTVYGCYNCKQFFTTPASISISTENGAVFDAGTRYSFTYTHVSDVVRALQGTGYDLVFVYEGRNTTDYPMTTEKPTLGGDYTVRMSTKKMYEYYLETGKTYYDVTDKDGINRKSFVFTDSVEFSLAHVHKDATCVIGNKLRVKCSECGRVCDENVYIDLENGATVPGSDAVNMPVMDNGWCELTGDGYVLLFEGKNYPLSADAPRLKGEYTVSLAVKSVWESDPDNIGEYRTQPIAFTFEGVPHTCVGRVKTDAVIDGYGLVARCRRCNEYIYDQSVSLGIEEGSVFCVNHFSVPVIDTGWSEVSLSDYIVLYEGCGDTVYEMSPTPPSTAGEYQVFITTTDNWNRGADTVRNYRTTPIHFSIVEHRWTYSENEFSLSAICSICGESAKVTLDASAVYEACRTFNSSKADQDLFYDQGWSDSVGIIPYKVIYNGTEIDDYGRESELVNTLERPTKTGSYKAKLVLDDNSCETKEMAFYLSGIPITQCNVVEYTENEAANFKKPEVVGNKYYVGTASELLWLAYNNDAYEGFKNSTIVITNDIIFNPLTILEDESILSGANTVYIWRGLGNSSNYFSADIEGNGHMISGLYVPEDNSFNREAGLINCGKDVSISNLNIENSYFNVTYATGVFIGALHVSGSGSVTITGCNSLHNAVVSKDSGGGFVGTVMSEHGSELTFDYCINDSSVTAKLAGGIIGHTGEGDSVLREGSIGHCINVGKINGTEYAGGIVAKFQLGEEKFEVSCCLNTGYIKSLNCESGIIGGYYNFKLEDNPRGRLSIRECVSIGELDSQCKGSVADILAAVGDCDYCLDDFLDLHFNSYYEAEYAYPTDLLCNETATRLTRSEVKDSVASLCYHIGFHGNDGHYSNVKMASCTEDGYKEMRCRICNLTIETVRFSSHAHYEVDGKCVYCGRELTSDDRTLNASLFSDSSWVYAAGVAALLAVAAVAVIIVKKKKKNG